MKKFVTLLLSLVVFATVSAQTTQHERMLENTLLTAGVYRLYPTEVPSLTPVPKGYKPFYISHYGRHGSRYVLRNHKFDSVVEILAEAEAEGQLKPLGREVLEKLHRAADFCKGRAGDLSTIGLEQHRQIAARMYKNYPEIFGKNPHITSVATTVPRVIMSMAAFNGELLRQNPKLDVNIDTGSRYMKYLNAYSYDNDPKLAKHIDAYRYPVGDWVPQVHAFMKENMDGTRILNSLFEKEFADKINKVSPVFATTFFESYEYGDTFLTNLFKVAVNLSNTPCGEDILYIFQPEEMYQIWRVMNMIFYFEKGPSGVGGGFLNEVSGTLLKEFIDDATEKVEAGKEAVTLRFGHDGCVMGVLNTMKVKNWSEQHTSLAEIEEHWHDFDIPMACNLQWIFYRNAKTGDVIAKLVLNEEQELVLPIESDCAPYYHWKDIKAYYTDLLKNLSIYNFYK